MKKIVKIFTIILVTIITITVICFFVAFYHLSTIRVINVSKDIIEMYVDEGDVVDCHSMLIPPEKYSHLLQIEVDTRMEVATYMMENNYKLKSGKQEFLRTDPTLDDLIGGEYGSFVFEEIQNNDEVP